MSHYDAIIVGSGPGGAMAADALVRRGGKVLMLERGGWVRRDPTSHAPESVAMLSEHYSALTPYAADTDTGVRQNGAFHCVGGQSVFYGAVALRYRERDFLSDPRDPSGAEWPVGYREFEPCYTRAERLLHVSGDTGADPTEPFRSGRYSQASPPLSDGGSALHAAARRRGLRPFRPPLAIARAGSTRPACVGCGACNGFACAVGAKGDASVVVNALLGRGLELRTGAAVVRILSEGSRVTGVQYQDVATGELHRVFGDSIVLAAGALATPHLILGSGLQFQNPGGAVIGRYLTRHCNAVICGYFAKRPPFARLSYKEFAVQDFYFGHPAYPELGGIGSIQQEALPAAMVERELPRPLRPFGRAMLSHLAGLIVMTEDEPRWTNRVALDRRNVSVLGLPGLRVHHRYAPRDLARRRVLITEAKKILAAAGAAASVARAIDTFSHALGTVRMGLDPLTSALDGAGRFRGFHNLYVVDGSALPTSAAVNPSLTIAANGLRVADGIGMSGTTGHRDVVLERRVAFHARA
ncbi:MAG: GMC family oxidoreductase [Gemmatimonadota bacterium]